MIFVDLCGVLADFDGHYESKFGVRPAADGSDIDWEKIKGVPDFYQTLPKPANIVWLWKNLEPHNPVILTTAPLALDFYQNAKDKTDWVRKNYGANEVLMCRPGLKSEHSWPGNILIDNREKYRKRWIDRGGLFILHADPEMTVIEFKRMIE